MSVNVKITSTMLGIEDHGILTMYLYVEGDGMCMGYGGFALSQAKDGNTVYSPKCGEIIGLVLKTLDVDKWEDLPGTFCRLDPEPTLGDTASHCRLGHIVKDKWMSMRGVMKCY